METQVPTKRDLMSMIRRFIRNKERGISIKLFAQAAGVNHLHFLDVFWYRTEPLTEKMQIRVNKAYEAWKNGQLAIMQNRNRTKFVTYRTEAQPRVVPSTGLAMVNGKIQIKVGMRNIDDYSQAPILERDKNAGTP